MADPTYPQNQPYCQPQDVLNALGSMNFTTTANTSGMLLNLISIATQEFESRIDRSLTPTYHVERQDGTGMPSLVTQNYPIISIAGIKNYINAQMLAVNYNEYQLTVDHKRGIVRVPLTYVTSAAIQFTQNFYRGNRNIEIDYWTGFTRNVSSETLTTTDNLTYKFANPTLAKTNVQQFGPIQSSPPVYRPIISVNGHQLVNTTYTWQTSFNGNAYAVLQDNIYYTVNWSAGTITFNAPTTGAITADYSYWYVPADAVRAVTKLAAIEVLKTEAVGAGGIVGQGTSLFQMGQFKAQYGRDKGYAFEGIIQSWEQDVAKTIARYQRQGPDMTGGYVGNSGGGWNA